MDVPNERLNWRQQTILNIILLISLFMPFYITTITFLIIFIILAANGMFSIRSIDNKTSIFFLWLFIIYSTVIAIIHNNIPGALIGIAFALFMIYFTYYTQHVRPEFIEKIITISLFASIFVFIFAFLEHLHIIPELDYTFIHEDMTTNHENRAEATFMNPNYFAMMAEFFIVFGLYKGNKTNKLWLKILNFILIIMNIISLFFTGNRTSFVVIIAATFVFYFVNNYKKQATTIASIGIVLLVYLTVQGIIPRVDQLLFATKERMEIWRASMQGIRDNLLTGQGTLAYMNVYMNYTDNYTQHAHNIFLDLLLNYGIIGCLLLLQPIITYGRIVNKMRQYPGLRRRLALICSLISVVLVHGLTDVTILWIQTGGLFLLIIMTAPNMLKEEMAMVDN